jgi:hypothetical protein
MILDSTEFIPAGNTALESSFTNCVVRSDARMDCCVWGTARLKLDLVVMIQLQGRDCIRYIRANVFPMVGVQ